MTNTPELFAVSVNPACCNGCGACAGIAPELFEMDPETEKPRILMAEAPAELVDRAMAYCPHDCIEKG